MSTGPTGAPTRSDTGLVRTGSRGATVRARKPFPAPPTGESRLLAGWHETGRGASLAEHHARYGPLPTGRGRGRAGWLIDEVGAAGLRGRGGAGFPTTDKLAAVAAHRARPVVVANGCEGEPASRKDAALLTLVPHLVIDGAVLAAHALGAREVVICLHRGATTAAPLAAELALRDDQVPVRLVEVPDRYVASESSALVNYLNTGDARPTHSEVRTSERGVDGRPTLLDNVETLAHLALIARYGAPWFRAIGTRELPGSLLITAGGAMRDPGVYEVAAGTTIAAALDRAGGPSTTVQAVLVGGYGGGWLPLPSALGTALTHDAMRAGGAALGAASLLALPAAACGLGQTAQLLHYLAEQSARQCGPCLFGLPAIADDFTELTAGTNTAPAVLERLTRRLGVIPGRGACSHPDGATRLAASALRTFRSDLFAHLHQRPCPAAAGPALFPLPRSVAV